MSSVRVPGATPIVGSGSAMGDRVSGGVLSALVTLTKPRLTVMVVFSALVGFVLADPAWDASSLIRLGALGLGTLFIVGSANAFNQILERHDDGRMQRTASRPLPSGRIGVRAGTIFACGLSLAGFVLLWLAHWMAAAIGAVALAVYVGVYTPLKVRSPWSTAAGAVSGAFPPLMGSFAAIGSVNVTVIFATALLFVWQFPHTWAIAVLHREDYDRIGSRLLPLIEGGAERTKPRVIAYTLILVAVSLVPVASGLTGMTYVAAALILGGVLLRAAFRFAYDQTAGPARSLLVATLIYLPVLLTLAAVNGSVP